MMAQLMILSTPIRINFKVSKGGPFQVLVEISCPIELIAFSSFWTDAFDLKSTDVNVAANYDDGLEFGNNLNWLLHFYLLQSGIDGSHHSCLFG